MTVPQIILGIVAIAGGVWIGRNLQAQRKTQKNLASLRPEVPTLTENGHTFRDLNKNGKLDPYEDTRLPIEERIEDLLSQMTVEEKAGLMFHPMIGMSQEGMLVEKRGPRSPMPTSEYLVAKKINHFNLYDIAPLKKTAEWYNRLQKLAERTRLGIPVTISSDPGALYSGT